MFPSCTLIYPEKECLNNIKHPRKSYSLWGVDVYFKLCFTEESCIKIDVTLKAESCSVPGRCEMNTGFTKTEKSAADCNLQESVEHRF